MRRLDPASSPTPPPDTVRIPIGDPEGVAVGPGHLPRAHEVDQRVRLLAEYPQDARHGPVAQGTVQGQVSASELDRARPADHGGLAQREQHQADSDSATAPPFDPLRILDRAEGSGQPLTDMS